MNRRALLASVGGSVAAISGCVDLTDDRDALPTEQPPRDGTPTDDGSATPSPTSTPAPSVTVESVTQQYGYATANDDAIHVARPDRQYVVADVSVAGGRLERDDFAWAFESSGRGPTTPPTFYRTEWGEDQWYEEGRDRGLLAFEMPGSVAPATTKLVWPTGGWLAEGAFLDRLTAPKRPIDASIAVSDADGESDYGTTDETVEVTMTNEGDVAGRYVGAVNRSGPMVAYTPVEYLNRLVGAGETATVELAESRSESLTEAARGDGESDLTYHLEDAYGGDAVDVAVSE